jgi:hypothetical protein
MCRLSDILSIYFIWICLIYSLVILGANQADVTEFGTTFSIDWLSNSYPFTATLYQTNPVQGHTRHIRPIIWLPNKKVALLFDFYHYILTSLIWSNAHVTLDMSVLITYLPERDMSFWMSEHYSAPYHFPRFASLSPCTFRPHRIYMLCLISFTYPIDLMLTGTLFFKTARKREATKSPTTS